MAVTINGTTGVAVPLGSAAAPAETNTTSATTGIYYPTSTTLGLSTNGTNAVTIDASQNVGIGASPTGSKLYVNGGITSAAVGSEGGEINFNNPDNLSTGLVVDVSTANNGRVYGTANNFNLQIGQLGGTGGSVVFYTAGAERMRIDSSGNLLVGTTSTNPVASRVNGLTTGPVGFITSRASSNMALGLNATSGTHIYFYTDNGSTYVLAGNIGSSGATTSFNTSSDYRLKENVAPLTTGLTTIGALNPVTYNWVGDKQKGEGFIAHELQEIIPHAVTGQKDAINEDGSIKPQGVDYSKIVVHLVAAIQELSAEVEALKAKVGA